MDNDNKQSKLETGELSPLESEYLEAISGGTIQTEEKSVNGPEIANEEADKNFASHRSFGKLIDNMKKRYGRVRDELENVTGDEIVKKQAEAKALRAIIHELETMQGIIKHDTQQQNGSITSRLRRMVGGE